MREPRVRLRVRVTPGAASSEVTGRVGEAWRVRVAAPPERGRANDELVRLLSQRLGVARSGITLVSGHTARDKLVELRGVDARDVERALGGTL